MPGDQQSAVLARAVDAATAIRHDGSRAGVLIGLAAHLHADQRSAVLARSYTRSAGSYRTRPA